MLRRLRELLLLESLLDRDAGEPPLDLRSDIRQSSFTQSRAANMAATAASANLESGLGTSVVTSALTDLLVRIRTQAKLARRYHDRIMKVVKTVCMAPNLLAPSL